MTPEQHIAWAILAVAIIAGVYMFGFLVFGEDIVRAWRHTCNKFSIYDTSSPSQRRFGFTINEGGKFFGMVVRINDRTFHLFFYIFLDIKWLYIRDKRVSISWVKGKWPTIRFRLWLDPIIMKDRN